MKVIGKGEDNTLIIQVTKNEIANLLGYYWAGDEDCPKTEIGSEIKISDMYDAITNIGKAASTVGNAAKELEDFAKRARIVERMIKGKDIKKTKTK